MWEQAMKKIEFIRDTFSLTEEEEVKVSLLEMYVTAMICNFKILLVDKTEF